MKFKPGDRVIFDFSKQENNTYNQNDDKSYMYKQNKVYVVKLISDTGDTLTTEELQRWTFSYRFKPAGNKYKKLKEVL